MAAQVLSGSGNVTFTNTTGQNVRIVIKTVIALRNARTFRKKLPKTLIIRSWYINYYK